MTRWWLAAVVALVGCAAPTYSDCFGGSEEVEATVEIVDGQPVFDWAPGTAYAVTVSGVGGRTYWHAQCGGDNLEDDGDFEQVVCLETPLRYGEPGDSPDLDRVNTTRHPKPLVSGETYTLQLNTLTEEDEPPPEPEEGSLAAAIDDLVPESDRDDPHCGRGFFAEVSFVAP